MAKKLNIRAPDVKPQTDRDMDMGRPNGGGDGTGSGMRNVGPGFGPASGDPINTQDKPYRPPGAFK